MFWLHSSTCSPGHLLSHDNVTDTLHTRASVGCLDRLYRYCFVDSVDFKAQGVHKNSARTLCWISHDGKEVDGCLGVVLL